jgi:hypothetical protein
MINTALAINRNWKLAEPRIRQYKRQHRNTGNISAPKDLIPIRKLVVFAVVVGLALSQCVVVIRPAFAPTIGINIQNFAFNPQIATIQFGDSVSWTNNDPVIYTLWFTNASDGSTYLLSPPINPGGTWTHAFPDKIRLNYYDFDRLQITGQLGVVPSLRGDFGSSSSNILTVTFAATVSGGTLPYRFFWTFGDGTSSTLATPSHTYQPGFYSATLTVTDSSSPNAFSFTVTRSVLAATSGGGGTGKRAVV